MRIALKFLNKKIICIIPIILLCIICIIFVIKNKDNDIKQPKASMSYKNYRTIDDLQNDNNYYTSFPILFNSKKGRDMLINTKYNASFFALSQHFASQQQLTSCGLASARIVLSALYDKMNIQYLFDKEGSLFKYKHGVNKGRYMMTEKNVLFYNTDLTTEDKDYDVIVRHKKRKNGVFEGGMNIKSLSEILSSHPYIQSKVYYINERDIKSKKQLVNFRKKIKNIMLKDDEFMISNFNLNVTYKNIDSGHFSPVAGYNEKTDMVLILDVASHYGTWYWIKLEDLFKSMISVPNITDNTIDRGYIIVKLNKK